MSALQASARLVLSFILLYYLYPGTHGDEGRFLPSSYFVCFSIPGKRTHASVKGERFGNIKDDKVGKQDGNLGHPKVKSHPGGYNLCKFYCRTHGEVKRPEITCHLQKEMT